MGRTENTVSNKIKVAVDVKPLSGPDELAGACDDAACFTEEVRHGKEAGEPISVERRAKLARWGAESLLAIALHLESLPAGERSEVGPHDPRG
jgi:hypothetical protein